MRRTLSWFLFLALSGCSSTPRLLFTAPEEAARIADAKIRSLGFNVRVFRNSQAAYDRADKSWWVNYRRNTSKFTDFSVRVDDKTKQAWFVTTERH